MLDSLPLSRIRVKGSTEGYLREDMLALAPLSFFNVRVFRMLELKGLG